MRTVVLASLRQHTRRYVAAVLAVTIGVAFVVITNALASSAENGLTAGIDAPYRNAEAVVAQPDTDLAADLLRRHPDTTAPVAYGLQPVTADDRMLTDSALLGSVSTVPELRWQRLLDGRFPTGAGEAVAEATTAATSDVAVGDALRVGDGAQATEVRVVGLVESPSWIDTAALYLTWPDLERFDGQVMVQSVVSTTDIDAPAGADVLDPAQHVADLLVEVNSQVDVVSMMVLLFAAVALFVSVLVIANTFSILFAQRRRDVALLRCIGATPRQVVRSVRIEALVIGTAASLLGLALGVGGGYGVVAGVRAWTEDVPLGAVEVSPWWLLGGFALGLAVTMAASWLPTRHTVRVSPLAALRPEEGTTVRTAIGRPRIALGAGLLVVGTGLLAAAVALTNDLVMVAGGGAVFVGVLTLGPVLVPALVTLLGAGAGRVLGTGGRLAAANAVRNPRRTATTTAALLVGVTLATAVLTGMATTRDGLDEQMGNDHPVDVALTAEKPIPSAALDRVPAVDGVAAARGVPGVTAEVDGETVTLLAPPGGDVAHRPLAPRPGTIRLPVDVLPEAGDRVSVAVDSTTLELAVVRDTGWGPAALVAPATLAELVERPEPYAVWLRADSGADPHALAADLTTALGDVRPQVENGLADRAWVDLQLDVLTWTVIGLLGVAVLIALVGIGNTLGLSVLERTREHALLRAVGLTRRQLRRMLGVEALLLTSVAALLGSGIGVAFAWVGVLTLVEPALPAVGMVVPVGQLAVVVLVAASAGLVSCLLPSRRASRVVPAEVL